MLPTLQTPSFNITIPSINTAVPFRPFLVREEKLLLMALEDGSDDALIAACLQIVGNCCLKEINVENLAVFDVEYIFLKLRAASVNNECELTYVDLEDEKQYKFTVDLKTIEIQMPEELHDKIKVTDEITIQMRWPTMKVAQQIIKAKTEIDMLDKLVVHCIESVYEGDKMYEDFTEEEMTDWLNQLDITVFDQIRKFLDAIPSLKHELKYTNSKGSDRVITLTGLSDFFNWR